MKENPEFDQAAFLRDALLKLGTDGEPMSRAELAELLKTPQKTLDNWMLDASTKSFRPMPSIAVQFVRIILLCNEKNYCITLSEGV